MKKITFAILILFILVAPITAYSADPWVATNDRIGLNVHWALGGFGMDDLYQQRLHQSRTTWVREHFYTEVFMVENPEAWFERYDSILEKYEDEGIKVLGMLAYGVTNGDFYQPDLDVWEEFVRSVVYRYKDKVEAWEIWNEPDSPTYLTPHNPETYGPILERAYRTIKNIDPEALVLNGGLSWFNWYFAERLFQDYGDYFDRLAVHGYYCENQNSQEMMSHLDTLRSVVGTYRPGEQIWITEFGCSTGSVKVTEQSQADYLDDATKLLLETGFVDKIFLYNVRNRETGDSYEDSFGLLDLNMSPRLSWHWYRKLPYGPYDQKRISFSLEQKHASELKAVLERYFGEGKIPVTQENWYKLVNAYIYGGYPVIAIVQSLRFGGKTIHPEMHYNYWQESNDYTEYIGKDLVKGRFVYAYGKARLPILTEQAKATELKQKLQSQFALENLRINDTNWVKLFNSYAYGGYPVEAIARAVIYGGKTVHTSIPWKFWQEHPDYQEYIQKSVPSF
ncbi:cellulase family glycosylhydrolase [Patescibacteria group bacterium]|nr:cellulase family glycosylhydrolase [Patescibacteria group bacterium]MBU1951575.1 cellulase family glycosylhydrolase [Patescibacteria group bacterium]